MLLALLGLSAATVFGQLPGEPRPRTTDARLAIDLFAAEPAIVTPTGITVDARGRVLVIENHTHHRPAEYKGPPADRIRIFEDTDGDGKPDRITTFFEGTAATMNLAVYRDGSIVVATRNEVFRLYDDDGDGKADRRQTLARLVTPGDYPHNGLSGFAFDFAGNIYFGMGENLGADYQLIGADGRTEKGGGEGGNIFRMGPDGNGLVRLATGFWNPFHLGFDAFGRLFAVDNDPDSRPPCRLLHIVEGGDYGYRFRNGRKGLHPFTAWNGELPGTLGMVGGTGEAPCGVLAYESDNLPADYVGTLLVTSWGDYRIDQFRLEALGASFKARGTPVVTGGDNFRPVGIALAPDGSLYVSDWVDKSYPVHGKGRIWHLHAVKPTAHTRPTAPPLGLVHAHRPLREASARTLAATPEGQAALATAGREHANPRVRAVALEALAAAHSLPTSVQHAALADSDPAVRALAVQRLPLDAARLEQLTGDPAPLVRAAALSRLPVGSGTENLLAALASDDPFTRHAATQALGQWPAATLKSLAARETNPARRRGLVVVLRKFCAAAARGELPRFLNDSDPQIRFVAVEWIADEQQHQYRPLLLQALSSPTMTRDLFEAILAALERLDGVQRKPTDEVAGEAYVAQLLVDGKTPLAILRRALRMLRPDHPALTLAVLEGFLHSADPILQLEAVRSLRASPYVGRIARLRRLAADRSAPLRLRAEAIVGLPAAAEPDRSLLIALAETREPVLRHEALRSLRGAVLTPAERRRVEALAPIDGATAEQVAAVLQPAAVASGPPIETDTVLSRLTGPADPAAGERIFFHPKGPGCYKCHQVDGRGGKIGPDLSLTGQLLAPRKLVESIVEPSKEIAPQFVPWIIAKKDGTILTGMLVEEADGGRQTYATEDGMLVTLAGAEIEQRRAGTVSIMPAKLVHAMTTQEFRDLLAFLEHPRPQE